MGSQTGGHQSTPFTLTKEFSTEGNGESEAARHELHEFARIQREEGTGDLTTDLADHTDFLAAKELKGRNEFEPRRHEDTNERGRGDLHKVTAATERGEGRG